jgi:hypothetical protein
MCVENADRHIFPFLCREKYLRTLVWTWYFKVHVFSGSLSWWKEQATDHDFTTRHILPNRCKSTRAQWHAAPEAQRVPLVLYRYRPSTSSLVYYSTALCCTLTSYVYFSALLPSTVFFSEKIIFFSLNKSVSTAVKFQRNKQWCKLSNRYILVSSTPSV